MITSSPPFPILSEQNVGEHFSMRLPNESPDFLRKLFVLIHSFFPCPGEVGSAGD